MLFSHANVMIIFCLDPFNKEHNKRYRFIIRVQWSESEL